VNIAVSDSEVTPDGPSAAAAEALAKRAVAREAEAWAEIFESHYRAVFSFVRYKLRGVDEAEDIASQVFEIAYARADRFDYRGVPIEGWLIGIARNLVRDHIKKIGRRGYEDDIEDANAPSVPDNALAVDLHNDLVAAMKDLTEDQQTVLSLRFLLDKSVADTAALMARSEDAVKNLQRRALAAMQRSLTGSDYTRELSP
jgi:RNA polymerase sigma-70 factor (ECF subfamily)